MGAARLISPFFYVQGGGKLVKKSFHNSVDLGFAFFKLMKAMVYDVTVIQF